jgi:MFS family permease
MIAADSREDQDVRGVPPPAFALLYMAWGLCSGFLTIALSYQLAHAGVSVAAIAGLVGLFLFPQSAKVLIGPIIDVSLTVKHWYWLATFATLASLAGIAATPLVPASMPLLSALALLLGIATAVSATATTALMAQTNPISERGAVSGWQQAGQLGGQGLGGGAGLWLAQHGAGIQGAALLIAAIILFAALPLRRVRLPVRAAGLKLSAQFRALGRTLLDIVRTRKGGLALMLSMTPVGLAASANLWSAVAGDWNASADLVALTTGALGGVASIPGALIGGYLADRYPRRAVFIGCGFVSTIGLIVMALAPHTPGWFGTMVLINAMLTGAAWAAVGAVCFECLGGVGAATLGATFSSAANLPVPVVTMIVGRVQTAHGSTAMLLAEAGIGIVSLSLMCAVMLVWRQAPVANPQPAR